MQDRYAGDVGDYGKFAMLRAMEAQGLKLGINWYRTETAVYEIHDDGKYNGMKREGTFLTIDDRGELIFEGDYLCDNDNLKLKNFP